MLLVNVAEMCYWQKYGSICAKWWFGCLKDKRYKSLIYLTFSFKNINIQCKRKTSFLLHITLLYSLTSCTFYCCLIYILFALYETSTTFALSWKCIYLFKFVSVVTSTTEGGCTWCFHPCMSVCLSVCLCLSVSVCEQDISKKLWTDLDKTRWTGWECDKEELFLFWWRSRSGSEIFFNLFFTITAGTKIYVYITYQKLVSGFRQKLVDSWVCDSTAALQTNCSNLHKST